MVAQRFISAFTNADFGAMRECLAPGLVAWVTDSAGQMMRLEGRDEYLSRIEQMDLPANDFSVELTQAPVQVDADLELLMVEVHAERDGRTLHNFAAHLLRVDDGQINEWWMADAKPSESDTYWAS
ncbi:MAG: nuclear transport factor 2 family protein [Solirubrobacterales bacterium]